MKKLQYRCDTKFALAYNVPQYLVDDLVRCGLLVEDDLPHYKPYAEVLNTVYESRIKMWTVVRLIPLVQVNPEFWRPVLAKIGMTACELLYVAKNPVDAQHQRVGMRKYMRSMHPGAWYNSQVFLMAHHARADIGLRDIILETREECGDSLDDYLYNEIVGVLQEHAS